MLNSEKFLKSSWSTVKYNYIIYEQNIGESQQSRSLDFRVPWDKLNFIIKTKPQSTESSWSDNRNGQSLYYIYYKINKLDGKYLLNNLQRKEKHTELTDIWSQSKWLMRCIKNGKCFIKCYYWIINDFIKKYFSKLNTNIYKWISLKYHLKVFSSVCLIQHSKKKLICITMFVYDSNKLTLRDRLIKVYFFAS